MTAEAYDITDTTTAAAVVGGDQWAAALVALDIARAVALDRRVTILDLTGGAPPLVLETTTTDPHGVSDCFAYGISFAAATHPTTDPNIFVIPSGTEPLDYAAILPSPRWDKLVRTAHDSGTLVIFVVPPEAAELGELLARVDRVVTAEPPSRTPVTSLHISPARRTPRTRGVGGLDRAIAAVLLVGLIAGALTYAVRIEKRPAPRLTSAADTAPHSSDTITTTATAQLDPAPQPPPPPPPPPPAPPLPSRNEGKPETKPQGRVAEPSVQPNRSHPTSATSANSANGFTVQFAASYDRAVAEELAHRLETSGFGARTVASGAGGHALYRVLLGPYQTRAMADSAGRATHQTYWVRERMP